ncbi:MAG TPA: HDOD domain-containing protein [Candidatus Hydrogenedentes bacterium]|nr:HDOD domain-containing protein [Candidatus Hydrogenedentota bacterium]
MRVGEVKRRIQSGEGLAALPRIARESLACRPEDRDGLLRIAHLIQFEPPLVSTIFNASDLSSRSLEEAVFQMGVAGIRKTVFQHAAHGLFPDKEGARLDRKAFWKHAFACAELTERLAVQRNSPWRNEAYVAGLLHDIGKPILDAIMPEGYSKVLEVSHSHALYVLEAEQRAFGVDHGLVGKWAAEYWGLPEPYVAAIWLHHHPEGVLEAALYPAELIALVGLADQLAHGLLAGFSLSQLISATEERRKSLGIAPDELEVMLGKEIAPPPEEIEVHALPDTALLEESFSLSRRLKRSQAMNRLHDTLHSLEKQEQILRVVVECLRNDFSISAGCCYSVLLETLEGVVWSPSHPVPYPLHARLDADSEREKNVLELLGSLLPNGPAAQNLFKHQGLMVIPLMTEQGSLGQIIFDSFGISMSEEDLDVFLHVGRIAGAALGRIVDRIQNEERIEQLAATLWKQEMTHRQSIRTERMDTMAQLASGAAHTINNPLTAISGRAQMLLSRLSSPEEVRSLETIIQQSRRISKILSNLMQFARPADPRLETTVLSFVMHHVVGVMRERLEANHIRIFEHYAPGIPSVQADRRQIEQVFINLILNAEQAMPHGGDLTITVKPSQDRHSVVVQISDTGHGIPANIIDRVFEPFFTTREETENTGLGLAVCHGIIERHRGAITLHGGSGLGATCTVTLPAATEKSAAKTEPVLSPGETPPLPHRPPQESLAPHIRPRVLIADPDEELREVVQQALHHRAYDVITAADGLEALAIIFSKPLDLVLLDPELTGPGGIPILQQLHERRVTTPIIAMLSPSPLNQIDATGNTAATLLKSFPMERLLSAIHSALSARHVA